MARLNTPLHRPIETTYEGARAAQINPEQALRRSVLAYLLWEDEFYESGEDIAARITSLVPKVGAAKVAALAIEARSTFNLRHVPLLLLSVLAKAKMLKAETVAAVIQRADELSELLAIHAKLNATTPNKVRKTIPAQMRRGLAAAFGKFDEYQLSKYDRAGAIRLRDVLFLCHAKASNELQDALWKKLIANELTPPDTWEVALSGGADKKEAFTRLIKDRRLGYFALLRNLRNMMQAGVDPDLVREAIIARKGGAERVLPFRYIAAARACPQLEPAIDQALTEAVMEMPIFDGKTVILVDVSRSMLDKLSARSDMTRMDAAAALACLIHGDRRVFSFSDQVVEVPPRLGMAGVDAIANSQVHSGTRLFDAVDEINRKTSYDRIIVITDEQAEGPGVRYARSYGGMIQGNIESMPAPLGRGYVINVASAKNGVGYGAWTHIDGFSEGVLRYLHAFEATNLNLMG